jgi:DNA-binding transcriptional MocR family regulator
LLEEAGRQLSGLLDVQAAGAGLHLLSRLPSEVGDRAVVKVAAERGADVWPLSLHAVHSEINGLLLAYGGVPPPLARAIEEVARGRPARS